MPNVEIDGTNSTVKTNVLTSQSASAITVPTGKVLTVTDAAGLTVAGSTVGALDTAATSSAVATAATAAAQYAIATQVPPSTSGKVLTSNGSAWTSATPAAGGGLIPFTDGEVTASNDATISFGAGGNPGFTATYDNYLIQMDDIKNVTTNIPTIEPNNIRALFMQLFFFLTFCNIFNYKDSLKFNTLVISRIVTIRNNFYLYY